MNQKIDDYIEKQKSPQKEICQILRDIIINTFPSIKEEMKYGVPYYGDKYYIVALKTHVNLGFSIKDLTKEEINRLEGTGKTKDEMRKRAIELLDMVGLSERKEHRPQKLSAGEQQRVAIARALANNPAIVLADEVTGNLDGKTKIEIIKLLGKLNIKEETTIVVVTHDGKVASMASRILFISDGKLLAKEKEGTS